jgi:hypothetical protein
MERRAGRVNGNSDVLRNCRISKPGEEATPRGLSLCSPGIEGVLPASFSEGEAGRKPRAGGTPAVPEEDFPPDVR